MQHETKLEQIQRVALSQLLGCRYLYEDTIKQAIKAAAFESGVQVNQEELKICYDEIKYVLSKMFL